MFVELNRSFRVLTDDPSTVPSDDALLTPSHQSMGWDELLELPRVVVLSEAGSGKTEEIRHATRRLRGLGKAAFFLRLEHVQADFEYEAFEEGSFHEFEQWIHSGRAGWILLDSIDEARLRDPRDFERAIRALGARVGPALQRARILLTGRTAAWRPLTDLALCERHLHYARPVQTAASDTSAGGEEEEGGATRVLTDEQSSAPMFTVVALDDLTTEQVRLFAQANQVPDIAELLEELERADAWSYTSRPLDLEELLEFWSVNRRLGSRLELMRASIDRRLREPHQDRDELSSLTSLKARTGARLLAAACTLTQQQVIAVPDGSATSRGLRVDDLLAEWSSAERTTLLQRPIFDEEIYGTVRFHHRSVREYLTAEWFAELLLKDRSRRSIERLFFREQYGLQVVAPGLRPVLPWLAVLDPHIQERACRLAPDLLLSGGDPSQLSLPTRQAILRRTCAQLAGRSPRYLGDLAAIQRFAAEDLTDDVNRLLTESKAEDAQAFLLRMVWQGRLVGAREGAFERAISTTAPSYVRKLAIRALYAIGSVNDLAAIREAVASGEGGLDRALVAELLESAAGTRESVDWLCACLERISDPRSYHPDPLSEICCTFVGRVDDAALTLLIERFSHFLQRSPLHEQADCDISQRYAWLLKPAGLAAERLIQERSASALDRSVLSVLHQYPAARVYDLLETRSSKEHFQSLVQGWTELKFALFWFTVEHLRSQEAIDRKRVTDCRHALFRTFVSFQASDFDLVMDAVESRSFLDDRLVALSLALWLYADHGRPQTWRVRLKKACQSHDELAGKLKAFFHPPPTPPEIVRLRRSNQAWKRRSKAAAQKERRNEQEWRAYLVANTELLRSSGLGPTEISRAQYYLHQRMRSVTKSSSTWSEGNWQSLEAEYGTNVAHAFRNGAIAYWRRYRPILRSEGATPGTTPFPVIFGLTGLLIESRETDSWAAQLDPADAALAFRYAMHELNGFPSWFADLYLKNEEAFRQLILAEVDYELRHEVAETDSHYIVYDINWAGEWLWAGVAPHLYRRLLSSDLRNLRNLQHLLNIIQGSNTVSDVEIAVLAEKRAVDVAEPGHMAQWFAVWTGVAPARALPALKAKLETLAEHSSRAKVLMAYLAQLVGAGRGESASVRQAYCTAPYLGELYLLAHQYIRRTEDLDRVNYGVYTPGLRDHAQDAREHLLALLRALPGKEAYVALEHIALNHPDEASRAYVASLAKAKAEADAAQAPWILGQVKDFGETYERTPSNHQELFDLAIHRLLDLKGELEDGDSSIAPMLARVGVETDIRNYIGGWLRNFAHARYSVPQEEELADGKRPDLRIVGVGFDAPMPIELKLAEKWTGPELFERLEVQLCGDYLRDPRSNCGVFLLVYSGARVTWSVPGDEPARSFDDLLNALRARWKDLAPTLKNVVDVQVVGIDLTRRRGPSSLAGAPA